MTHRNFDDKRLLKNDSLAKHTNASSVSLVSRDNNFLKITKLPEVRLKNRIFINREENETPFTNSMIN